MVPVALLLTVSFPYVGSRAGKEPLSAPSVIFHTTVVGSIGPLASYERILELPASIEFGAPTIVILISVLPAVANASSGFKT